MAGRGATREQPAAGKPGSIRRALLLGSVLALLAALAPHLREALQRQWSRPVSEVSIEGSFALVSREQLAQVLAANIDAGFWQLDIQRLQRVLAADPWIDSVAIRRRWPDRLQVAVQEQSPIARWGATGFVNQRGELIATDGGLERLAHLPRLLAEDGALAKLMQNYQLIAGVMGARNLTVSEIALDPRGSWRLQLGDEVALTLGRHQLQARLWRFAKIYDAQLAARWVEVRRVDARYDNGLAVAWRDQG